MESNKLNRIARLESKITDASECYYRGNDSGLTDLEFDSMCQELKRLDPRNSILQSTGFGIRIRSDENSFCHPYGKIEGIGNKIFTFAHGILNPEYSPKLDGCAIINYYVEGVLQASVTRGDGFCGFNVTRNTKRLIPSKLKSKFTGYTRGECVVPLSKKDLPWWKGTRIRNIATGTINSGDPDLRRLNDLEIPMFTVFNGVTKTFMTGRDRDLILSEFKTIPRYNGSETDFATILEKIDCPYLTDGVVVAQDGDPSKVVCAIKLNESKGTTEITGISWRTTGTRKIFPTLLYKPVEIADSVCQRASGGSYLRLKEKGYGIGAEVEVLKCGEIIPNVVKAFKTSSDLRPKCSYGCDESFLKVNGSHIYCTNPKCQSVTHHIFSKLLEWKAPKGFSKDMMKILNNVFNCDVRNVLNYINSEICDPKWLTLDCTRHQSDMLSKTLLALHEKPLIWLGELANILQIDGFGGTASKKLEVYFAENITGQTFTDFVLNIERDKMASIVRNSRAVESWFNSTEIIELIVGTFKLHSPEIQSVDNDALKICISGKLNSGTKKDFGLKLEGTKFQLVGSVDDTLFCLITNKPSSSKGKKAEKLGLKVYTEDEFNLMLEKGEN